MDAPDPTYGITMIREREDHAFIWSVDAARAVMGESCEFVTADEVMYEGIIAIVLKKGFPYKGLLDHL